jgi:peptidyl-prolyl cis-trans isomerase B (cyclophilin B)
MARTNDPNSASGQFFICSASCAHLDGAYAAFGKVIDELSLATVLDISHVETTNIGYGFADFPVEPIAIKTIVRNN